MKKSIILPLLIISFCCMGQGSAKLFILIGQSNMAGRAEIEPQDTTPLATVMLLNDRGVFEVARNPLNIYSDIRKGPTFQKLGPGYYFAREVAQRLQDTIYLVVNARGGTEIERFIKGDTSGYYQKTLARVEQALKAKPNLKPEAIVWHQGESNSTTYSTYIDNLARLVADYRRDLNAPQLPFIAGEVGRWNSDYADISREMRLIPTAIASAYLVCSEGLTNCDKFHFDSASQRELGRRYAQKYLEIVSKQ